MLKAKIVQEFNKPVLYVGEKRVPPIIYALSDIPASNSGTAYAQRNIKRFGEAGIDLVAVDTELRLGWKKSDEFDSEPIIEEILTVADANPNAKVLVRLHLNAPYWWLRDNPDEQILYRCPEGDKEGIDNGEPFRLIADDGSQHLRVSLASEKWKKEAGELLKKICRDIKNSAAFDVCFAIQPACGMYGEWHQWGTDCGKPMLKRYCRYIKEKYTSEQELKKAWNDENACFSDEYIISHFRPELYRPCDEGSFRNPKYSADTADSQRCMQEVSAEDIVYFCRILKNELPDKLTGAFYCYYLGIGNSNPVVGHLAADIIFKNTDCIDFLCGPAPYLDNRNAENMPMQRAFLESLRLHGILWLTEMDQAPTELECFSEEAVKYEDETIAIMRRNVLQPIASGQGMWYYDHRIITPDDCKDERKKHTLYHKKGWWENEKLMNEIEQMQKLIASLTKREYVPQADILLVYDTEFYYHTGELPYVDSEIWDAFGKSGAAFDCIYLSDIKICDIERYKCIVFVNCYYITKEMRSVLKDITKDKHTVWMYAAGFCSEEKLDISNIKELTGITVKKEHGKNGYDPYFTSDDGEKISDICVRKGNVWYIFEHTLSKELASLIANESGAHIYCKLYDPLYCGGDILVLNSSAEGEREIIFKNGKITKAYLSKRETAVFDTISGERIM